MTALSGRVDLGAGYRVWGKLGNLLGLLSPAPCDVSEFRERLSFLVKLTEVLNGFRNLSRSERLSRSRGHR